MTQPSGQQPASSNPDLFRKPSLSSKLSVSSLRYRHRKLTDKACNDEELLKRKKFILRLAKALLAFGAPSHRIESQLAAAAEILGVSAEFVHLPNIVLISVRCLESGSTRTHFVRATGRVALSSLHKVHQIYRDVIHDGMSAEAATDALRRLLRSPPIYPLYQRCIFAFICASIICVLSFGGSVLDMWVSGTCAGILQYLGLNAASKSSSMYANVYEISVSIVVAFVARGLGSIRGSVFCYNAIASAGIVLILPGFTILISALELMSRNLFCGSVRLVYAIIYTLFLGFGLTIGSDFYFLVDRHARQRYYYSTAYNDYNYTHGHFLFLNGSTTISISGIVGQMTVSSPGDDNLVKGCYRDPSWSWLKQPLPTWTIFLLVPLYSLCSSLANLQKWRSLQLPVMVFFSCAAFAANRATSIALPGRTDIVSAAGAFVIGCLGNIYSRLVRGTAFTSMVTGVLFLVPSGIAQGGGVSQAYDTSAERYTNGFALALRMISVAAGVTVGLFVSQVLVYTVGTRKHGALFAF